MREQLEASSGDKGAIKDGTNNNSSSEAVAVANTAKSTKSVNKKLTETDKAREAKLNAVNSARDVRKMQEEIICFESTFLCLAACLKASNFGKSCSTGSQSLLEAKMLEFLKMVSYETTSKSSKDASTALAAITEDSSSADEGSNILANSVTLANTGNQSSEALAKLTELQTKFLGPSSLIGITDSGIAELCRAILGKFQPQYRFPSSLRTLKGSCLLMVWFSFCAFFHPVLFYMQYRNRSKFHLKT